MNSFLQIQNTKTSNQPSQGSAKLVLMLRKYPLQMNDLNLWVYLQTILKNVRKNVQSRLFSRMFLLHLFSFDRSSSVHWGNKRRSLGPDCQLLSCQLISSGCSLELWFEQTSGTFLKFNLGMRLTKSIFSFRRSFPQCILPSRSPFEFLSIANFLLWTDWFVLIPFLDLVWAFFKERI